MVNVTLPSGEIVGLILAPATQAHACSEPLQWNDLQEHSSLFGRTEEHGKPGCMVSCRTVQNQRNQLRTELVRGCLAPRQSHELDTGQHLAWIKLF